MIHIDIYSTSSHLLATCTLKTSKPLANGVSCLEQRSRLFVARSRVPLPTRMRQILWSRKQEARRVILGGQRLEARAKRVAARIRSSQWERISPQEANPLPRGGSASVTTEESLRQQQQVALATLRRGGPRLRFSRGPPIASRGSSLEQQVSGLRRAVSQTLDSRLSNEHSQTSRHTSGCCSLSPSSSRPSPSTVRISLSVSRAAALRPLVARPTSRAGGLGLRPNQVLCLSVFALERSAASGPESSCCCRRCLPALSGPMCIHRALRTSSAANCPLGAKSVSTPLARHLLSRVDFVSSLPPPSTGLFQILQLDSRQILTQIGRQTCNAFAVVRSESWKGAKNCSLETSDSSSAPDQQLTGG